MPRPRRDGSLVPVAALLLMLLLVLLACSTPTHQTYSYAHIPCPVGSVHSPGSPFVIVSTQQAHLLTMVWHPSLAVRATTTPASVSLGAVLIGPFSSLAAFHLAVQPDGVVLSEPRTPVAARAPVIGTTTWTGSTLTSRMRSSQRLAPGYYQVLMTIQVRGMDGTTTGEGRCILKIIP